MDTETTIDSHQSLKFGVYQFCERNSTGNYTLMEEGVFYADNLKANQLGVLQRYVQLENGKGRPRGGPKLKLYPRSVFVEKVMYTAIQARAAIVAFNPPL